MSDASLILLTRLCEALRPLSQITMFDTETRQFTVTGSPQDVTEVLHQIFEMKNTAEMHLKVTVWPEEKDKSWPPFKSLWPRKLLNKEEHEAIKARMAEQRRGE